MKNLICYSLLGLFLVLFVACFPGKFIVKKYDPSKPATGFVYALPKTKLKIDIPYAITYKEEYVGNKTYKPVVKAKLGEIKVDPIQVPDIDQRYEIETDIPDSITWLNNFSINLTEANYLSSSKITFLDGTLPFVKGLVDLLSTAAKFDEGKGFTKLQEDPDNDIAWLEATFKENKKRILELLDEAADKNLTKDELEEIKAKIDVLLENEKIITEKISNLKTRNVKESNITITSEVDLEKSSNDPKYICVTNITKDNCPALKKAIDSFKNIIPEGFIQEYWLGIRGEDVQKPSNIELSTNAYIYRIPFNGRFEIRESDDCGKLLAKGMLQVNQFGNIGQIIVKPKRFAKKVIEVELHPKTGGLKKYSAETEGAAAESLVTAAKDIVSTIQEELKEKTELEKLQDEIALLNARIDKIKKEQELEDLKSGEE